MDRERHDGSTIVESAGVAAGGSKKHPGLLATLCPTVEVVEPR
jgi:hypothetical protein